MEIHRADIDIGRNAKNIRIWVTRRRPPLIGARKYALKERYSSRREVRARLRHPARTGGGIGIRYFGRHGRALSRSPRPRAA